MLAMKQPHQDTLRLSAGFRPRLPVWLAGLLVAGWAATGTARAAEPATPAPTAVTNAGTAENPRKPAAEPAPPPAEPATPAPAQKKYTELSNFSDQAHWMYHVLGTGVRVKPSGNGFDVDYSPEAAGGGVSAGGYISTFALRGDFTLDIDYALRKWPEENGVRLGVAVRPFVGMCRASTPEWGEVYSFVAGPFVNPPTDDEHGSLRLVREGGTLRGYYRSSPNEEWVLAGSRSDDPVFAEDFQVRVASWTGNGSGGQAVSLTLSNFALTAERLLPGPFDLPDDVRAKLAGPAQLPRPVLVQPPSVRPPGVELRPLKDTVFSHGILEEDLELDLAAAAQSYQSLITQFDAQRPLAAQAIFRLGECYRRMGRMDDARAQYERILREFSDQTVLVALCQRYAASVGGVKAPVGVGAGAPQLNVRVPGPVRGVTAPVGVGAGGPPAGGAKPLREGAAADDLVPSGLVARWAGEGNALDSAGTNHGKAEGKVTFLSGQVGLAFGFDGTTADVRIPASPSLDVGAGPGFTIAAWILPEDLSVARPIVEWNSVSDAVPYGVHFWTSEQLPWGTGPGCLFANLVDTDAQSHYVFSGAGLLHEGAFQHVALTYLKETGEALLYLNGAVVANANLGSLTPQTTSDLYLGYRPAGDCVADRWIGKMDEVSLYARALKPSEIESLYRAGSRGKTTINRP